MEIDHPLTLTVEQAGRLLGVGRSTAYELARSGELECVRLRRRLVVPTARVAECLGLALADVWRALEVPSVRELDSPPSPTPVRGKLANRAYRQASLF